MSKAPLSTDAVAFLKAYHEAEYEDRTGFLPYCRAVKKKSNWSEDEEEWELENE